MLKSTVTLQLLFHVDWKWIPNSGELTVVLFVGPKLIYDIQRDTDIGIALSLAPIIILHVLRGRQNLQLYGVCQA